MAFIIRCEIVENQADSRAGQHFVDNFDYPLSHHVNDGLLKPPLHFLYSSVLEIQVYFKPEKKIQVLINLIFFLLFALHTGGSCLMLLLGPYKKSH